MLQVENYERIARVIDHIRRHFKEQPSLEELAELVHLSPFHFQRLFTDWAGVSPKKFLQYTSLEYAKSLLRDQQASLFDAAEETGLSGTGRLHDLFISIEAMTPGEYKRGGEELTIRYSFADSPFGRVLIASTEKGICHMAFCQEKETALQELTSRFPNAGYSEEETSLHRQALAFFQNQGESLSAIKLHLKGTGFQLKVWDSLLKIPEGRLSTYGRIAGEMGRENASRAVGTAIGSNPVAFLIPCHRVIQGSGNLGGYMWGETRKTALIAWEGSRISK